MALCVGAAGRRVKRSNSKMVERMNGIGARIRGKLRRQVPAEVGNVDAGAAARFEWILHHVRCPACTQSQFTIGPDSITCDRCAKRYPITDGTIDFLDHDIVTSYGLAETENVSDHPFDGNARALIEACTQTHGMVLDCGSGYKAVALPNVVQMEIVRYPHVDILGVNQLIPFQDASFDAVFSLDVLEHVNDPFTSASEITRVLKPGGVLYLDLPFLQAEHGYPHHYFNATRHGSPTVVLVARVPRSPCPGVGRSDLHRASDIE